MIPVYIIMQEHSVEVVSYFMLISLLGGLLAQWPIGLLSDKYGRRRVIALSALSTGIVSFLFIFFAVSATAYYILGFLLGLSIFALYPLAVARANDVVNEDKNIIEISRTLLFSYGLGSFVAPLLIGFGLSFANEFLFASFGILGLFLWIYALSKERIADEDLSHFVNMPVASGVELITPEVKEDEV